MSKILDKFLGVIGVEVEEEETLEPVETSWVDAEKSKRQRKNNLLSLPTPKASTMMLFKAKAYEEVESIAQHIKQRRSVIVNFEEVDKETAQSMVDFLSGAVFALDGSVQKVSLGTFLFATNNMDVMGQINEEDKEKAFFKGLAWTKKQ